MAKLFKFLGIFVGLILLLVVAASIILPMVIDPNDFKQEIVKQVKDQTGRDLKLAGDIDLSVFPWLGVKIDGVQLSNAKGFGDAPFAAIKQAAIRVKLKPLLDKRLEVDTIGLDGVELNLAKNKQGVSNWDDLIKKQDAKAKPDKHEKDDGRGKAMDLAAFSIGGVEIKNALVSWNDQQSGQSFKLDNFNFSSGALDLGDPAKYLVGGVEASIAQVSLDDRTSGQKFQLSDLNLKSGELVLAESTGFTIGGVDVKIVQTSLDNSKTGQKIKLSDFNLNSGSIVPGKPVGLNMSMLVESNQPAVKASLGLSGSVLMDEVKKLLSVDGLKLSLDADGAALPKGKLKADLSANVAMSLDGKSLSIQNLNAKSGALDLKGNLKGMGLDTATPVFSGKLNLAPFNAREWMASQGLEVPPMADPKALGKLAASLNITSKGTSTNLNNLLIQLDDTKINGNAILRGGAAAFKLNVDSIDLDRYMATGKPAKTVSKQGGKSSGKTAQKAPQGDLLPVETLRGLNLNGSVNIGRLKVNKIPAQKIALTIKAKNGVVQTTQKIGAIYKGSYNGSVNLDVKGKTPRIRLNSNLSKVDMGSLIKTMAGEERLTGQGHFTAGLSTSGNNVNALKRSLNGKMSFKFLKGAIKGINLAAELRKAKALLSGQKPGPVSGPLQTDFSQITGSAVVKNGVARNSDLKVLSPFIRVNGKGTVNLVSESLDYTTEVFVVETSKGQGGRDLAVLEELKRKKIGVPVRFKGPLAKPKWEVQWQKVLVQLKKEELKDKLQKKLLGGDKKSDGGKTSTKDRLKQELLKKLF